LIGSLPSRLEWALSSSRLTPRLEEGQKSNRSYVVYFRVSTQRQSRSGLGLAAQRASIEKFLSRRGGQTLAEYTEIEDGKKCDRAQLRLALGACRVSGATLLIAQLDRLGRNVAFIAGLIEIGTDFVAADFPLANSFNKHILAAIAESEVKLMSDRRKAICAVLKARGVNVAGHLKGARVPRADDLLAARAAQLSRATERAIALAPLLRELRDAGKSIHGIAGELTRLEIETPCGGAQWHSSPVRRLFLLAGEELPGRRGRRMAASAQSRSEIPRS
jgi:DNA invertase Pin-like site-specific DNA recombinase